MKNILLLLFVSFWQLGFSQYNEDWEPAEVYLKDGSILKGTARLSDPSKGKESLRFTEGRKKPTVTIKVKDVDSVVFELHYRTRSNGRKSDKTRKARFVTFYKNKKKTKQGFAELVVDGEVKLLKRVIAYSRNGSFSTTYDMIEESLLVRADDIPEEFHKYTGFKKRAIEYFKDCPSLVNRIENKTLEKKDLEAVVRYYNDNCAK